MTIVLNRKSQKQRWKYGADQFAKFWKKIDSKDKKAFSAHEIGCLKAIFLGERAASWKNELASKYRNDLKFYGLRYDKDWIYDPKQVKALSKKHRSIFDQRKNAREIIHLSKDDMCIGLLLGFPAVSVRRFAFFQSLIDLQGPRKKISQSLMKKSKKDHNLSGLIEQILQHQKKLRLTSPERQFLLRSIGHIQYIDIFGVCWIDIGSSLQSRSLQKKLHQAFIESGINKI